MKPDRDPIMVVEEQNAQRCQVLVRLFGAPGCQQALDKAADFMIDLATRFADDKLQIAQLYPERDRKLQELGLTKKRQPAMSLKVSRPQDQPAKRRISWKMSEEELLLMELVGVADPTGAGANLKISRKPDRRARGTKQVEARPYRATEQERRHTHTHRQMVIFSR
jgi:hypothetical protein